MNETLRLPGALNAHYIDQLYRRFRADPASVLPEWQVFFRQFENGDGQNGSFVRLGGGGTIDTPAAQHATSADKRSEPVLAAIIQDRVDQLIHAYRVRGHMIARIDPLHQVRPPQPELDPGRYGLTADDMERVVSSRAIGGPNLQPLGELITRMSNTYCRSIGAQFMHIDNLDIRHWLQSRMESSENRISLTHSQQLRVLSRLTKAVVFEQSVRKKYVGAKTFSLEGCESLIPLLDLAIERAAEHGALEIVIGMAHRGRLNVLTNIMGKRPADVFREFEDHDHLRYIGGGDVKYHLGYSGEWQTAAGRTVALSLCFNPSHLEFINPIALGRMRVKQDRAGDVQREQGLVFLVHGDAAFAGEGVVQEVLNLSQLPAYTVGGTIHIIINNQIGFTTPPSQGCSAPYVTAVAKMLQIPIFHVNGEDPEAVAQVVNLALDFRYAFKRDVVIDMYGYRRHGHNEMDEPMYTQPILYKAIRERKTVRESYVEHLMQLGKISQAEADEVERLFEQSLEDGLAAARSENFVPHQDRLPQIWNGYVGGPEDTVPEVDAGVPREQLSSILRRTLDVPAGFHRNPRLERLVANRQKMADGEAPLDWAAGEALAIGTLAAEGVCIRLTGQDSERGTFSHRHAVLHDYETGERYEPLNHLVEQQGSVEIYNSPLSEISVLGFEYGYSLDAPDRLVMWEAQFGDFVNTAQVIIDQFIVSAEDKWRRLSGLVLLLPHGYEGQGPEHSSARIERFLAQAAEHNIQIAQPSTPAQMFHLLRRQVHRKWRKPLIVFTPKSLLRHPACVSSLDELEKGRFQRVIPDYECEPGEVDRILLCSGKIYYELLETRRKLQKTNIAIVRVEQFYPMKLADWTEALAAYADETPVFWVQDEPKNMGAWHFLKIHLGERLLGRFPFAGIYRAESASPATGSSGAHKYEQKMLIEAAMGDDGAAADEATIADRQAGQAAG